jgi:uncharacterized protein
MRSYVYLHGFASSPRSSKAQFFRRCLETRGVHLEIPALDGDDFENLTLSGQLAIVEQVVHDGPAVLIGSSMGGYLAALYAEKHREVERLVLMAPAFDFRARWAERVGPQQIEAWRTKTRMPVFHYGLNRDAAIGYSLYEDAAQYAPYPRVDQPALILHGLRDDVVCPARSRQFCELNPHCELHLFESGHELTNVLEPMWALVEPFLFA